MGRDSVLSGMGFNETGREKIILDRLARNFVI